MKHVITYLLLISYMLVLVPLYASHTHQHQHGLTHKNMEQLLKQYTHQEQLLVITLMVKDEEAVIENTLAPYVEAGIQNYLIFDTGSTDNTIQVAREYFDKHNITHAYIKQEPFIDFANSRNRALELTEQKFPYATFILMPDAEWYMKNIETLVSFCQKEQFNLNVKCYSVRICNESIEFYTPRLIRCHKGIRFAGAVHEVIPAQSTVPKNTYFYLNPSAFGIEKSRKRWLRDKEILHKELEKNPKDSRSCFYLAQTYHCLSDLETAYTYYKKRSQLAGWPGEDFMTYYRLGQITAQLAEKQKHGQISWQRNYSWQKAMSYYLTACEITPRAEPLVKIAEYYLKQNNFQLAYLFAKQAVNTPEPNSQSLFIDTSIYTWNRYELLSRAAWYLGEFDVGQTAAEKAQRARPDLPHLTNNLNFYYQHYIDIHQQIRSKGLLDKVQAVLHLKKQQTASTI